MTTEVKNRICSYTEEDADRDSYLYFQEEVDLSSYSLIPSSSQFQKSSAYHDSTDSLISDHFQQMRCSEFAIAALEVERKRVLRHQRRDSWEVLDVELVETAPSLCTNPIVPSTPFPWIVPLSEIRTRHAMENTSREARLRQLKKDVERDRFLLNSRRVIGAAVGLTGVLEEMSTTFDSLLREKALPLLPSHIVEELSFEILFKSSRTHSGALAFYALQNLIDCNSLMLLPQSSITPPIKIKVSLDSIPSSSRHKQGEWGIVAKITCEFIYAVQPRDEMSLSEDPNKFGGTHRQETDSLSSFLVNRSINISFEDYVYLPINLAADYHYSLKDIQTESINGKVLLTPSS